MAFFLSIIPSKAMGNLLGYAFDKNMLQIKGLLYTIVN